MKKRILSIALALTMMAGLSVTALAAAPTFIDVPEDTWYYTWVTKAAQQGWVSGVGDGRFDPEGSVTFAQFALMLDRALYPDDIDSQPAGAQWWTAACEVAAKHGLFPITDMAIRDNWNAVANTPIEREQMAQMMYNALVDKGVKLPSYAEYSETAKRIADIADVDNYVAVTTCYTIGLLNGDDSGNFAPRNPMTRAQACVVLCNIYGYVTGDVTGGTTPGQPTQPIDPVNPVDPVDPVQPDVPRPAGAVGGRYDVSAYDVPADANKDGWITEAEVQAVLAQLREEYPDGATYDPKAVWKSPVMGNGIQCAYIAYMFSDRIFGNLPKYVVPMERSRVGDVLNDIAGVHRNIVLNDYGQDVYEGVVYPDSYTTVDGGAAGVVHWGNVEYYHNWPTNPKDAVVYSRYPKESSVYRDWSQPGRKERCSGHVGW